MINYEEGKEGGTEEREGKKNRKGRMFIISFEGREGEKDESEVTKY